MPHRTSPELALQQLLDGNARYASDKAERPNQSSLRRMEVATSQNPFAAVVGCSDSRVPVEVIFDQGVGDLFVVRTAGNLIEDVGIASVEFAVANLGVQLVLVMGHRRCGAVQAAVNAALAAGQHSDAGGEETALPDAGYLPALVAKIQPAVDAVRAMGGDILENATQANARLMAKRLENRSALLYERVRTGNLRIASSIYDLDTGLVTLL